MPLSKRLIGPPAAALALALVGAACGSAGTDPEIAAITTDESEASAADSTASTADSSNAVPSSAVPSSESAPASAHAFPDLQTSNIVDGSPVNLADELAGGDTPVMLWFWAPH